jgi:YbbR domain-containing protein
MRLRPRYPGLFLLALLTSIALWYGVAGQRRERISEKRLLAPLTLINIPQNLVITSDVPERVAVGLRGPLSALREAEAGASLDAVLDLASAQPGTRTFTIKESAIHVPEGVQVVSIEPSQITLKLERIESRQVAVEPRVEGSPAPGYAVTSVQAVPDSILISGPGSLLAELDRIQATPVSIEGATGPVEAEAEPVLPHPLLRPATTQPLVIRVNVVAEPTPVPTPAARSPRRR